MVLYDMENEMLSPYFAVLQDLIYSLKFYSHDTENGN